LDWHITYSIQTIESCQPKPRPSRNPKFHSHRATHLVQPQSSSGSITEFELHRPSNKGTKLLLKVIKAIIIIKTARSKTWQGSKCTHNFGMNGHNVRSLFDVGLGCAVDQILTAARKNKRKHNYHYSVITIVHKSAESALDSFHHVKADGFDEGRLLTVKIRPDRGPILFVSNVYNHVAAEGKQEQALLDQPPVLHGHRRSCPMASHRRVLLSLVAWRPVVASLPFRIPSNCLRKSRLRNGFARLRRCTIGPCVPMCAIRRREPVFPRKMVDIQKMFARVWSQYEDWTHGCSILP